MFLYKTRDMDVAKFKKKSHCSIISSFLFNISKFFFYSKLIVFSSLYSGMCGSFDDNSANDITTSIDEFALRWK